MNSPLLGSKGHLAALETVPFGYLKFSGYSAADIIVSGGHHLSSSQVRERPGNHYLGKRKTMANMAATK